MLISTMNDIPGDEVTDVLGEEAITGGGDAVLAVRFDASETGGHRTEVCASGTAVTIRTR